MKHQSGVRVTWLAALLSAAVLLALGAGGAYFALTRSSHAPSTMANSAANPAPPAPAAPPSAAPTPGGAPLPDVVVTMTEEAVRRAGIQIATVTTSNVVARLRVPGTVQANAYREVAVTPLVGGRVTRVLAELGQSVRRGQGLAEIYSPEIAEAQTRYLSAHAELDAHERMLRRTVQLVEIGAASQQELEQVHAAHTAQTTTVEGTRSRLVLLGMTPAQVSALVSAAQINATISISAPLDGVVTIRQANVGLNVDASTELFKVVDLSSVWIVGELYEKDFARARVGSRATVKITAYPELTLEGRVDYIDPQVNVETRTARIRVEVPNRRAELRFGMYAEVQIDTPARSGATAIPRSAVQMVADRSVIYLADPKGPGRFVEREVRLGESSGDQVEVLAGLEPGDTVVTTGSFAIRAERERLGQRTAADHNMSAPVRAIVVQ